MGRAPEYAVLIIIIIGALCRSGLIKRGIQGRLKGAADDIGDQFSVGNTNVIQTMTTSSQTKDTFAAGVSKSQLQAEELTTTRTNAYVMNVQQEFWGKQ